MPRNRLLPLLIVLFFIAPPAPQAMAGPETAAPAARSRWSGPIQLTNSTNSSWDPSIYVDGSGNIHLAWQDGTDRTSIRYKSFAPSGEVIMNDTVLVDHIDSQPPIYLSSRPLAPRLDFNDGELVLFWNDTENHPSGQTDHDESLGMLRFSPDLKSRRDCWLPIFAVDRLYYGNPLYAFDSKGNIHFAYAGNTEWNGEPDVWYVKTNSTGAKLFSKLLAKNETEVGVAVDEEDNVHLVWRNETGNLTYCRLDQNGTEQFRINITGRMEKISTFTIIASNVFQGADILFNENSDIFLCPIDYNGSYGWPVEPIFWRLGGDERFYFDSQTPLVAKSDLRGSTYLFGYGHPGLQSDPKLPYYVINGVFNEYAIWPDPDNVSGLNLVDYGYTELGPPFSTFVFTDGLLGGYAAYSSDRLTWEDPAGGINIYLKQLGPYNSDLFVRDIGFSNPSPLQEDNVLININVGYNGTEQITDFRYYLYLDGAELDHGQGLLGPDNTSIVTFNWTASWGMHNFSAQVIAQLFVEPLSNNEKNASLYVAGRPDISVEEIVWDPPSPLVGDPVNITARIGNSGESAAEFRWGIEVNGSIVIMSNTRLDPGERGNFSAQWRPALPGNYTILVLADRTDPYELELGNNSLERTINVSPALISVEILSPADGSRVHGMVNVTGRVNGIWGEPVLRLALGNGTSTIVPIFMDGGWSLGWNTVDVPNGMYNITASAGNGWVEASVSIQVKIDNPLPNLTFSPAVNMAINESETAMFEAQIAWVRTINASFTWTVNGIEIAGQSATWVAGRFWVNTTPSVGGVLSKLGFSTNWTSNGTYLVKVDIRYFNFEEMQISFSWNLTVRNVNTPPVIWRFSLPENLAARQKDPLNFWVEATDPEGDVLNYTWFVDGTRCETAPSAPVFNLPAPGKAGEMKITLSVSDGESRVSHNWTVTVLPEKKTVATGPVWWPWAVVAVVCAATAIGLWAVYRRRKPPKTS